MPAAPRPERFRALGYDGSGRRRKKRRGPAYPVFGGFPGRESDILPYALEHDERSIR